MSIYLSQSSLDRYLELEWYHLEIRGFGEDAVLQRAMGIVPREWEPINFSEVVRREVRGSSGARVASNFA